VGFKWEKRNLLISAINAITLSNGVFQFLGQTRKLKKKSKKVLRYFQKVDHPNILGFYFFSFTK